MPLRSLAAKLRHEEQLRQERDELVRTRTQQANVLLEAADLAFLASVDLLREALGNDDWSEVLSYATPVGDRIEPLRLSLGIAGDHRCSARLPNKLLAVPDVFGAALEGGLDEGHRR